MLSVVVVGVVVEVVGGVGGGCWTLLSLLGWVTFLFVWFTPLFGSKKHCMSVPF